MPAVSIVVPIYKTEKYLTKCVDSLLCQSLSDIEIVLVDDGSPDNAGYLAEKYSQRDSRIVVVHRNNGGLGPARNSGIDVATGQYLGFVDSDDWVEPSMYESLYSSALTCDADITVSGHCDVTNGVKTYVKKHPLSGLALTGKDIQDIRLNLYGHSVDDREIESFPMSVCMSIYKRSFIEDNRLRFKNILSEDIFFNLNAYRYAYCISFIGTTDYCYRKDDQESITRTFDDSKLTKYIDFCDELLKEAQAEDADIRSECMMRSRRTSIDYCRLYVGLISQSGNSVSKKINLLKQFYKSGILEFSKGYPLDELPPQQELFHKSLMNRHFLFLLLLTRARLSLKKKR